MHDIIDIVHQFQMILSHFYQLIFLIHLQQMHLELKVKQNLYVLMHILIWLDYLGIFH